MAFVRQQLLPNQSLFLSVPVWAPIMLCDSSWRDMSKHLVTSAESLTTEWLTTPNSSKSETLVLLVGVSVWDCLQNHHYAKDNCITRVSSTVHMTTHKSFIHGASCMNCTLLHQLESVWNSGIVTAYITLERSLVKHAGLRRLPSLVYFMSLVCCISSWTLIFHFKKAFPA